MILEFIQCFLNLTPITLERSDRNRSKIDPLPDAPGTLTSRRDGAVPPGRRRPVEHSPPGWGPAASRFARTCAQRSARQQQALENDQQPRTQRHAATDMEGFLDHILSMLGVGAEGVTLSPDHIGDDGQAIVALSSSCKTLHENDVLQKALSDEWGAALQCQRGVQ